MMRSVLLVMSFVAVSFFSLRFTQENHPPDVKLLTPKAGAGAQWNVPISYSIAISDKEDGDSKFDEINPLEVLLEVAFVKDAAVAKNSKRDRAPLYAMLGSNCMTCHAFETKLIGPPFTDISKRYPDKAVLPTLIKHVREGSKGVWGDIVMPTHPELSNEQIGDMVKWILNYKSSNNISYYLGTEGSFRLVRPANYGASSSIILTAGYRDHNQAVTEHSVQIKGIGAQ